MSKPIFSNFSKFKKGLYFNLFLIFFAGILFLQNTCKKPTTSNEDSIPTATEKILILVSLDGFRHDYIDKYDAITLKGFEVEGVRANALMPVFPSKTFPNHYTQVTGLYPENHGIIANNMFNAATGGRFSIGSSSISVEKGHWYGGEPIWVTAEKQGLKTAAYFWPGSAAAIQGIRPTYWKAYNGSISNSSRVDQVLAWLNLPPEDRPRLITLYFSSTDNAGHAYGPNAPQVGHAVAKVDANIHQLFAGIQERKLEDYVNLVIVSDHGMTEISRDSMIFLDDYINLDDVYVVDWSPIAAIRPDGGKEEEVYQQLLHAHPKMTVYKKENIPAELHYKNHPVIQPILAIADEGWSIGQRAYFNANPTAYTGGTHGYLPTFESMGGIFLAKGPDIKEGLEVPAFSSIHLYELMCAIMEIKPANNDGNLEEVKTILKK